MKKILWVDDEIDLLKPYSIFLEEKGYSVVEANNGQDAIEILKTEPIDIVFLDENMPGLSGMQTLSLMKEINSIVPIVMITKNEEENLMNMAVGNRIADFLIKPVNPNQILLTLKKHIFSQELVSNQTTSNYRIEFGKIAEQINSYKSVSEWIDLYKKLLFWEFALENSSEEMKDLLRMQKEEANKVFAKFIKTNYQSWFSNQSEDRPMFSHEFFKKKIFPMLDNQEKVFLIVVDNFRYDQWLLIKNELANDFTIKEEMSYFSILPTATQYARNAIFSGLTPLQIQELYPQFWVDEESEENKNSFEKELIQTQLDRFRRKHTFSYAKINNSEYGEKYIEKVPSLLANDFNVCIINFVDMLSHAKTDSKIVKELASTEEAYRSVTLSWFKHSFVKDLFRLLAKKQVKVIITTDHGTIRVNNFRKVVGDKNTNVNLRYKVGKNLDYKAKEVFEVKNPSSIGLPAPNLSSTYIFACENDMFVYPNNLNYYASYYKDTFQHGGISLEEMILPIAVIEGK